jgi:type I restriction enzyme S subunit
MEVKPGYKQSEAGVIPEDWEVKPLKRISPRQSVGLVINPSTYFDKVGTVPLLVGSNVSENAIDSTTANRISQASNELLPASRLVAGDLVTVRVGEPGVTAVVPPELDGCNCASMMIVRQHSSFDSHWLCCMMNSQHGRRQVEHVQYGTAQKQFNISDAVDFIYPVPPIPEQRAIAEALSDVDALVGVLDRLIAKKHDLKQAAMQQLLTGQTRLPGFHGEWKVKRLRELADIRSGGTPNTGEPRFWDGDIPWSTPTDITALNGRKYLSETSRMITRHGLKASSAEMIPAHSIVMTSRATIGECAINTVSVSTNQGFKNFIPLATIDVDFLYYLLTTQKQGLISLCGGSTFLEIGKTQLAAYQVRLPSVKAEQTAIAEVLADMDAELAGLEQRREKTRALKQAMMQELLTGRTRLVR